MPTEGMGRARPGVRLHPCPLKTALWAGKDIYLDAACQTSSRPGFNELVLLRTGDNLVTQSSNRLGQRLQFRWLHEQFRPQIQIEIVCGTWFRLFTKNCPRP